ncbi:ice-binding family protein [Streptomyces massasporeus]|uniref:Ice-binding family protein n=1 Tax=Streptomyces massasporeus TaxID=67324 RepID=A0ABW6LP46_9ACTN
MKLKIPQVAHRCGMSGLLASALAATVAAAMVALTPTQAVAIATPVPLATAADFSVLAGQGVTNTGPSVISQDLGTHPNPSITGFPPGLVLGEVHAGDAVALQAKSDLVTAYNNAAGQATDFALPAAIGNGQTLLPGVHTAEVGVGLTGDLILNAGGNPNAVWVFQIPEALTTASASRVLLTNGASPCNVYWQIGSSATLDTNSTFVGTIMALTSISVNSGANIEGRALARNGSVTLDDNRIFLSGCATSTNGGTTTGTTTGTTGGGLISGGLVTGGLLGGPIASPGSTSGNVAGSTSGNTAGNTSGNTAGNTAGNTTGGNGGGNGGGHDNGPGHDEKPGGPGHHKPGGSGHDDKPGKPGHHKPGPGDESDHGKGPHEAYGYGKQPHEAYGYGKQPHENYGYGGTPKGHEGDDHSKGLDG